MPAEDEFTSKEKLKWLGLSEAAQSLSNVESEMSLLEQNIADYTTFKDHLNNGYDYDGDSTKEALDSFGAFNSYLQDQGFTSSEADNFITKIQQNFTDEDSSGSVFDEFKTFALNQSSFEQLKSGFGSSSQLTSELETEGGEAVAGIKFHESGGVTRAGISVPAGTAEIFGQEVHFSQSANPAADDTGGSGGFNVTNISATDTTPYVGETTTISVDVENTYAQQAYFSASLTEDGSQIANKGVTIDSGQTKTVSFDVVKYAYESHDYRISSSSEIAIAWIPSTFGFYGGYGGF